MSRQRYEFEVWQDGIPVATATANDMRQALNEALRYAHFYGEDGPVSIYSVKRELVTGEEQR